MYGDFVNQKLLSNGAGITRCWCSISTEKASFHVRVILVGQQLSNQYHTHRQGRTTESKDIEHRPLEIHF